MTTDTLQPYDFAAAARVKLPLRQKVNAWARKSSELIVDQWAMMSRTPIELSVASIDARSFGEIQASWVEPCCGTELTLGDSIRGLLVGENKQLRILLLDVLGGCDSETNDSPLTPIEISVAKLIFEMMVVSFGDGWLEQEPLQRAVGNFEPSPARSRAMALDQQVLVCRMNIQVGESAVVMQLVLPHDQTKSLIGVDSSMETSHDGGTPISQENISAIEVELVARLGETEVNMADLTQLSPGDIVVLDQSVLTPIQVLANQQPVFTAWPGKKENSQILKLQKVLEPGQ